MLTSIWLRLSVTDAARLAPTAPWLLLGETIPTPLPEANPRALLGPWLVEISLDT